MPLSIWVVLIPLLFIAVTGIAFGYRIRVLKEREKSQIRGSVATDYCPFCAFGTPIIYDQKHDCCTTCVTKWKV